jgi:hypothetical protein
MVTPLRKTVSDQRVRIKVGRGEALEPIHHVGLEHQISPVHGEDIETRLAKPAAVGHSFRKLEGVAGDSFKSNGRSLGDIGPKFTRPGDAPVCMEHLAVKDHDAEIPIDG